jgi:hypothetical protein
MRGCPALLLAIVLSCSGSGHAPPRPAPSPSPPPTSSPVQLRDPAAAILADSDVGLTRTAARDHLTAAEAASLDVDQSAALQTYTSWGWIEESTRSWRGAGKSVDDLVLITLRPEGAHLAYEHYAMAVETAPFEGVPCPAAFGGLDDCLAGTGAGGAIVAGRLAQEVFVINGSGVDVSALAAVQASRLPSA